MRNEDSLTVVRNNQRVGDPCKQTMVKKIRRTLIWIVGTGNVLIVIGLLLSAYSDRLHPESFPLLSLSGLLFPVALVATIALMLVWLLFYWRGAIISIVALLLSLPAIRLYYPINRTQEVPGDVVKVMSYNVLMFAPWNLEDNEPNPQVDYILGQDADIVCLQESSSAETRGENPYVQFKKRYPYIYVTKKKSGEWMSLLSKYPILSADTIPLKSHSSMAMGYVLKIGDEKTFLVNCHLQSVGLSVEEKGDFKRMVENQMNDVEAKSATRSLLRKLRDATVLRASEAESVAEVIASHREKGYGVIVCGDFNDTPISYAHRTIAAGLTDCYVAAGNGAGYSYQQNGMNVRIDNILCSNDWTPVSASVDKEVDTSDHFPVVCCIKKQPKE